MTRTLGQGDAFGRALESARELRLPHGTIVEGLPGSGKSTAAREIAQALLCGGLSAACDRRVELGHHADLQLVELPEDRQDIPVDRIRELQAALERRPVEGRARVAIVDPADRLNEQGQNALLKTLEEPGPATFLLLVTSRPESLLETVRSRAIRLRILPLEDALVRAQLAPPPGALPAEIDAAVRGCGGSLGLARRLLDDEVRALATRIATFLAAPAPVHVAEMRVLLDGVSNRTETEQRLRTVCAVARAQLRLRWLAGVGVAARADGGYGEPFAEPWISALEAVFDAEQDFAYGIPANQVLEGLWFRLVGLLGGAPRVS